MEHKPECKDWTDEQKEEEMKFLMGYLPLIVSKVSKQFGKEYKAMIDDVWRLADNSRLKKKRKIALGVDKAVPEKVWDIVQQLELYWNDDLPLGIETKKSWMEKIAEEYGYQYEGVRSIEKKYRPKWYTPKR